MAESELQHVVVVVEVVLVVELVELVGQGEGRLVQEPTEQFAEERRRDVEFRVQFLGLLKYDHPKWVFPLSFSFLRLWSLTEDE